MPQNPTTLKPLLHRPPVRIWTFSDLGTRSLGLWEKIDIRSTSYLPNYETKQTAPLITSHHLNNNA